MNDSQRAPGAAKFFWQKKGIRRYIGPKRVLLGLGFAACLIGLWHLRRQGLLDPHLVFEFIGRNPFWAPAMFVGCYAVFSFFLVPTLPLNIGAGLLWGSLAGAGLASFGGFIGACAAFLLIRTAIGQPLAARFNNSLLRAVQESLEKSGWRLVAFTRVNPIFPSGPLNFVLGLTSISFFDYAWATLIFQFPPTLAFSILGAQATDIVIDGNVEDATQKIMLASLALTIIFGFRYVGRLFSGGKPVKLKNQPLLQDEN